MKLVLIDVSFRRFEYHVRGMTPINYALKHQGKLLQHYQQEALRILKLLLALSMEILLLHFEENILPITGTDPRSILMLDNASIHHVDKLTQLVSRIGAIIWFLPACRPDYAFRKDI